MKEGGSSGHTHAHAYTLVRQSHGKASETAYIGAAHHAVQTADGALSNLLPV